MKFSNIRQSLSRRGWSGQALVEYALILFLVAILFGVTLAATGPAIGNVFSNVVVNLLGQNPDEVELIAEGRGSSDAFWATVEWVKNNPPEEAPIPDNPIPPPSPGPTAGPSPTFTATVPTNTPVPTSTLGPTATPTDFAFTAPWLDKIDNPEWWRVDTSVYLGGEEWFGQYYANRELSGAPVFEFYNRRLGMQYMWNIDFDWPGTNPTNGGPVADTWLSDNFSIKYTRRLYVGGIDPVQVRFTTTADDGVRLWLNYQDGCASVASGGAATGTGGVYTDSDDDGGNPTRCLVIDNWRNQGPTTYSVVRTLQPGYHTLQLDYFEASGGARVKLDITGTNSRNLSDTALPSGNPNCNWNRASDNRSNSPTFIWEENSSGQDFPANMRCHLELRGYVDFTALTSPKLIFWDVWDVRTGTSVWLEIAEYNPDPAQRTWTRINLRSPGATNYNWTRNVVDLSAYVGGWATKQLAMRFVMENTGSTASPRRWYVDDIEVRDWGNNNRFFRVCSGTGSTPEERQANCGSYWNLDSATQKADFITTGRWDLGGDRQSGGGDMAWDSNPGASSYANNYESSDTMPNGVRVNYVELNGWVDLTGGAIPDAEGDDGLPQISFSHAYDLNRRTQLEVQWTRDQADTAEDAWQTVQVLVPWNNSNTQANLDMVNREVPLNSIPNWNTQPFRLRFAMLVGQGANPSRRGWWIDEIYIERQDRLRYSDYPFSDDAEDGMRKWTIEGQWGLEGAGSGIFGSTNAFADSPGSDYTHNTNASLILRYPIDLNNDSPENLAPESDNIQTGPATRPTLTFWHWRQLGQGDNIIVEWSKDRGLTWTNMWAYYGNFQLPDASNTRDQRAWERIVVDMSFLQAGTAATPDLYDDDVLVRFRLDARNNRSVGDGVYVDNISIADYTELAHRLWDPSQNPGGLGPGDNMRFSDDIDSGNWSQRWHPGGGWSTVTFDQRSRLVGLHESPPENTNTPDRTYSVLEMARIIDLRGVTAADAPTLYFWNRYYSGSSDVIGVEISRENAGYTRSLAETDYRRVTGWDNWVNVWRRPTSGTGSVRVDTWIREQISLDSFVGNRIRIQFVFNAYSGSDNRDGWFIDDILIEHRKPTPIVLPFFDAAQNLTNWVAEGTWGLAPDQWRGSGGGPASLGSAFWTGTWYDCQLVFATVRPGNTSCTGPNDVNLLLYSDFNNNVQRPYQPGRDLQTVSLDINYDLRTSGRPPGGSASTWADQYAARFVRPISVQAGDYTFISVSDDGVRLKWEPITGGTPCAALPACWNIINNWTYHGRTVDIGTVNLAAGDYNLTLEWFEGGGDATIILSAGKSNFSFGDSPKAGNGPAFPVVNSVPFGNSSLILKRPLRLIGTTQPELEYFTRYDLPSGTTANVEVSTNGGFDWTRNNLSTGFTCPSFAQCGSQYNGRYPSNFGQTGDNPADWQMRRNNLASYVANGFISLRFRLNTGSNVADGWYIADIQVNAASIVVPSPTP